MVNRLLKIFGSLKLAVALLVALTAVLTVATFYESKATTAVVMAEVYRSWWFNTLLGALALNLIAAALLRWPWKRKHVGFVITHAGLVVILGGCSAGFHFGTEGFVELRMGEPARNEVRLDDQALYVSQPDAKAEWKTPLRTGRDGRIAPQRIHAGEGVDLAVVESYPNSRTEQVVSGGGAEPNPAIEFQMASEMAHQRVTQWLVAADPEMSRASLGMAQVRFVVARDAAQLQALTGAPTTNASPPAIVVNGNRLAIEGNTGKKLAVGADDLTAVIAGYWPDFRIGDDHKPMTASDHPNNPAAVVILTRGADEERYFVFANPEMPPIVRTLKGQPIGAEVALNAGSTVAHGSGMTVVLAPDGSLQYAARSKQGFKAGRIEVGKPFEPGWMDFQITVAQLVTNAVITERISPAPADAEGGVPAVRLRVRAGNHEETAWLRFGGGTTFHVGDRHLEAAYAWNTMPLPFSVALEDFVVERDEGSDNVAGWTAKVIFEDTGSGLSQRAAISMNHPAWFKGYKFAQSSWNPNDLKYTALQVKRDPAFVTWLTWAGSGLVIVGIGLMFYARRWV